jgi:hypothetical protein
MLTDPTPPPVTCPTCGSEMKERELYVNEPPALECVQCRTRIYPHEMRTPSAPRRDGDAMPAVLSEEEVEAVLRLPLNHFDAAIVTRLLATLAAERAKRAEVERELSSTRRHLNAAEDAAGHSPISSRPLSMTILDIKKALAAERTRREAAELTAQDARLVIAALEGGRDAGEAMARLGRSVVKWLEVKGSDNSAKENA